MKQASDIIFDRRNYSILHIYPQTDEAREFVAQYCDEQTFGQDYPPAEGREYHSISVCSPFTSEQVAVFMIEKFLFGTQSLLRSALHKEWQGVLEQARASTQPAPGDAPEGA